MTKSRNRWVASVPAAYNYACDGICGEAKPLTAGGLERPVTYTCFKGQEQWHAQDLSEFALGPCRLVPVQKRIRRLWAVQVAAEAERFRHDMCGTSVTILNIRPLRVTTHVSSAKSGAILHS
eukprot:6194169-Pleurochrysis_carterae.AAC.4